MGSGGSFLVEEFEMSRHQRRFGQRVIHLPECDSTQIQLGVLLEQGAGDGTLVIADQQTRGKGRQGRFWLSHSGALQFSLAVKLSMPLEKAPRITLLTGVALFEALASKDAPLWLKWPNDILVAAKTPGPLGLFRKAGGILVELSSSARGLEHARIGIGLNLSVPEAGFPEEMKHVAGALSETTANRGKVILMGQILDAMEHWMEGTSSDALFSRALEILRDNSSVLGQPVQVPSEGLEGIAVDFDHDGALLVEQSDGRLVRVIAGDVWPSAPGGSLSEKV
jgi:BirA family transcriptional regulator, biotin operon repressor / biotin---[acetyl-CoA-carboxylase] ligase